MTRHALYSPLIVAAVLLFAHPLFARQDAPGCKDHPLLTRMPNFSIQDCEVKPFDAHTFTVADEEEVTVEGKKTYLSHVIRDNAKAPSDLEIQRNFENALHKVGGETTYKSRYDAFMRLDQNGREIWVHVHSWNDGEGYDLTIVEKKPMEQEISAAALFDTLNVAGFVALSINFDTNKATIRPDSQAIIDEVAAMLTAHPQLIVSIEGHTDASGTPAHNKTLSQQRAEAVVAALVARGIDGRRLSAVGWGQDKPIADNSSDEGKAKNRRVEIVKR